MCGIAGIVGGPLGAVERDAVVRRMTDALRHRGPDDGDLISTPRCTLGFRRLSIIDVEAPSPPCPNEHETIWTVCNGQIYNSVELRRELEQRGHRFRTQVDTEVLPHLYEEYGEGAVERLDGMFALAVWDAKRRTLLLARDRAGEKPLFYWRSGNELTFASELVALLQHPGAPRRLDPAALARYLLHGFFPAPRTPIAGLRKLSPGETLVFRDGAATIRRYWDLGGALERHSELRDKDAVIEALDDQLAAAVRRRSRSDVPFGVFLSGGLDSSTVLAYCADQNGPGVPVFSLGHQDRAFDEAGFAAVTARHFQADYHEVVLDEGSLADGLQRVGEGFSEPLGDASTIPTHLLALAARQSVKVILSGEGADEMFGGYPTYLGDGLAQRYRRLPAWARRALSASALRLAPVSMGNVGLDYLLQRFFDGADRERLERHHVWFGILAPEAQRSILAPRVCAALSNDDPFDAARRLVEGREFPDGLSQLLYMDFTMYLPDDLLTKVDRATMLASLEARAPFLDHHLTEFVAGLPSSLKIRGLTTKAILRETVSRRLPREILARRKRGFNIPFSRWLLASLGADLRQRFAADRVEARGLFRAAGIQRLLDEHLTRAADHRRPLFALLALDLWCDKIFGHGTRVELAAPGSF